MLASLLTAVFSVAALITVHCVDPAQRQENDFSKHQEDKK